MFNPIDFAIITALDIERDAILKKLGTFEIIRDENIDNWTYYKINFNIPNKDEKYKIIVVMLPQMGNTSAGLISNDIIKKYDPKHVIMLGIAGAIKGEKQENEIQKGDVVIATKINNYELGKVKGSEIILRGDESTPVDIRLLDRIENFTSENWKNEIDIECPNKNEIQRLPKVHFGPIASGEKVIRSNEFSKKLLKKWPELIAVEMESWGVSQAALYSKDRPRFISIRGISDYADSKKDDIWRKYAVHSAAAFLKDFLLNRPVNPINRSLDTTKYLHSILRDHKKISRPLYKEEVLLYTDEIIQLELIDEIQKEEKKN